MVSTKRRDEFARAFLERAVEMDQPISHLDTYRAGRDACLAEIQKVVFRTSSNSPIDLPTTWTIDLEKLK